MIEKLLIFAVAFAIVHEISAGKLNLDKQPSNSHLVPTKSDAPYEFICYQAGLFPHPYECRRYHVCSLDDRGNVIKKPREFTCKQGLVYDSVTTHCKKQPCVPLLDGSCSVMGQGGSTFGNPYMFYMCLYSTIDGEDHLIPHLFNCVDGEEFINGDCRDPTPPAPELDADGKCIISASYYYPDDCNQFIRCRAGEEPTGPEPCDVGYHFHGWRQTCIEYECKS